MESLSNPARTSEFEKHGSETTLYHVDFKNAHRTQTCEAQSRTAHIWIENRLRYHLWHLPKFGRPTKRTHADAKAKCPFPEDVLHGFVCSVAVGNNQPCTGHGRSSVAASETVKQHNERCRAPKPICDTKGLCTQATTWKCTFERIGFAARQCEPPDRPTDVVCDAQTAARSAVPNLMAPSSLHLVRMQHGDDHSHSMAIDSASIIHTARSVDISNQT